MMNAQLRSADPGLWLSQLSGAIWVRCPNCEGAAKVVGGRLTCAHCGHAIQHSQVRNAKSHDISLSSWRPRCERCGSLLQKRGRTLGVFGREGALMARVRCPLCGHSGCYPAWAMPRSFGHSDGTDPWFRLPLYLTEQIGERSLWVYNPLHLALLDAYLGASLRERAIGLSAMTMMARLPRWMKAASARPKLRRAFDQLREKAAQAGIA
jgi:hypothetical protein